MVQQAAPDAAARSCEVPFHEPLSAAMGGWRGTAAADRLCVACVELFDVDAAAISVVYNGVSTGTLGASSAPARLYDELQFTLGEGPCLDSVAQRMPVLVADLADQSESRWPAYAPAMLSYKICSVFAVPVVLAGEYVGALDLYRERASTLTAGDLEGALIAAELAQMPMLDLLAEDLQTELEAGEGDAWAEMQALSRVEINQATGMLVAQLDIEPAEALVRLRAYAYAANRSATAVALDILDHGLRLDTEE